MKNNFIYNSRFTIVLPVGLLFFLFIYSQRNAIAENFETKWNTSALNKTENVNEFAELEHKQRGAHIFGYLDSTKLQPFIQSNYKWITMVPYGAQKDFDSPKIAYFRGDSLHRARRDSIWKSQIEMAHTAGFKVFLKPHIWLTAPSDGKWRSDIYPSDEHNWKQWQKNYREYILRYAKMAQENNVELFSIGTELSRLSIEKSDFWLSLIQEVRHIYSGKITYAANWYKEYEGIPFWGELDYIGIQAYFPLVKNKYPSTAQLKKGWKKYLPAMESISKKYNRKILFTEIGYKSTADSAIEPWQWLENYSKEKQFFSNETQVNCYKAFFDAVWPNEWFAGVHIWQLRSDFVHEADKNNLDFTPQGKPAEMIIAQGFE